MAATDADRVLAQASRIADYDTLREIGSQLAGLLTARQRSAGDESRAAAWSAERRGVLDDLDGIRPGTEAVSAVLTRWSARLAQLRRDTA